MLSYTAIQPGTPAPDFTLPATTGGVVSLADFRGRPVVVSPVAVNPGVRVVLAALESISADAPTPYGVIA